MALQQGTASKRASTLSVSPHRQTLAQFMQRRGRLVGHFLLSCWAHLLTGMLGLIVLTALLIPLLSYIGLDVIAKPLFFALHTICAQIPSHSFFISGHQLGLCARNLAIYSSMF